MSRKRPIDWSQLAEIAPFADGTLEAGGTDVGRRIVAELLGEDTLASAFSKALSLEPGSEAARSVLALLRLPATTERCREVVFGSADPRQQEAAARLLADVAEASALALVNGMLMHSNPEVQRLAAKTLDALVMAHVIDGDDELEEWLERLAAHSNPDVRNEGAKLRALFIPDAEEPES